MEVGTNEQVLKKKNSCELHLFWHQVTGHNILLKYDKYTLCKPLTDREVRFYQTAIPPLLEPFVPGYRGAVDVSWVEDENNVAHLIGTPIDPNNNNHDLSAVKRSRQNSTSDFRIKIVHSSDDQIEIEAPKNMDGKMAKMAIEARSTSLHPWSLEHCASELNNLRLSIERDGVKRFILLENLTQRFSQPCVLDLKLGTRTYGDDECEAKKERKMKRSIQSTSHDLGVRLAGMEVYDVKSGSYHTRDKYYGQRIDAAEFKACIREFLYNGKRLRCEIIEAFKARLKAIANVLQKLNGYRFFSSSLLLIYDGLPSTPPSKGDGEENEGLEPSSSSLTSDSSLVDVRVVDFAYTTWPDYEGDVNRRYSGPDTGYLLGLQTIIGCLEEFQQQQQPGNEFS